MTREPLEDLDPHDHAGIHGFDLRQDIQLKRRYAKWMLIIVGAQLVVADARCLSSTRGPGEGGSCPAG
jgi:hypothetical protein